jgi:sugar lactone lactonase YvrE
LSLSGNPAAALQNSVLGKLRVRPLAACLVLPLALADLACSSALAATLPVTNCNDAGSGSLRDTVARAQSGDTVDLRGLDCNGLISLVSGELDINVADLTLIGPGASNLMLDDGKLSRTQAIVNHRGSGTLRLERLSVSGPGGAYTIVDNKGIPASACITSNGTLVLDHAVVTECKNNDGGAIVRGLVMQGSTVSGNSRNGVTAHGGTVSIVDSTISGNDGFGCVAMNIGKADTDGDRAIVRNSTISDNTTGYVGAPGGCIHRPVTISSSTVAFNAIYCGLGCGTPVDDVTLFIDSTDVIIDSTIFSNINTAPFMSSPQPVYDVLVPAGTAIGGHNNLMMGGVKSGQAPTDTINADPLLQPLADNGGPTMTHALGAGSPAIDAGNNLAALPSDQRGLPFLRIFGAKPDIGAFELQPAPQNNVTIGPAFTGSWFDPAQSGHGLMLEVLPDNRLLALWFAFDPQGTEQSWFGGVGTYNGDTATITDAALPVGGRWIPNFDPGKVVREPWGTLTFTFTDHDHGKVSFNSVLGYGSGSMNLLRLTSIPAPSAADIPIGSPGAVTSDASGNVYFSSSPNLIFKLDTQGKLTRIAGTGPAGFSGDGGPATQAQLNFPLSYPELQLDPVDFEPLVGGLAADAAGNLYIADAYNNRIRKIDTTGSITTFAGNGQRGNTGDGGPATLAQIYWPQGVAVDPSGALYVTSAFGPLRKISPAGIISTLVEGYCGPEFLTRGLCAPEEIALDKGGNVFVADGYCRIRKVTPGGAVATVAGDDRDPSGSLAFTCGYFGDGGPAVKAGLSDPYSVAVDASNNLFIADTRNHCVRKVSPAGIISTYAGTCTVSGFSGDAAAATSARMNEPRGVALDPAGNVYVADTNNHRIRRISADGIIKTVAGNGALVDGPAAIGRGISGSWFDPNQSGHGLMIEVLSDNRFLALWFAFNPEGTEQSWFGGVGTYSGNTATITDTTLPTGGTWIPNFDPAKVVRNPWGKLTFTFTDCNHGKVDFNSVYGYGSGSMNLLRLTMPAELSCP